MYSTAWGYQSSRDPPILMRRKFSITLCLCCWLTKTMVKFGSNPQEINHNGCSRLKGNADTKLSTWLYIRWREALQSFLRYGNAEIASTSIYFRKHLHFFLFFHFFPVAFDCSPSKNNSWSMAMCTRNSLKIELICSVCLVSRGRVTVEIFSIRLYWWLETNTVLKFSFVSHVKVISTMLHRYVFRKYLKFIRNGILLWMLEPTTHCGDVFTAPISQITLNLGLKTILMQLSLQLPQLASWLNWWSAAPVSRRSRVRIPYKPGFFF